MALPLRYQVRVFHNETEEGGRHAAWDPLRKPRTQPGDVLFEVGHMSVQAQSPEAAADEVFAAGNTPEDTDKSRWYRHWRVRSLSVGDVVSVHAGAVFGTAPVLTVACEPVGWQRVDLAGFKVTQLDPYSELNTVGRRGAELDGRDSAILAHRRALLDAIEGPRVGDWVEFADGPVRRIACWWARGEPDEGFQTCDGGSFHLGEGGMSVSGSLYDSVPSSGLVDTGRTRDGSVWFFHHDYVTRDNGVYTSMPLRVFRCEVQAPRS